MNKSLGIIIFLAWLICFPATFSRDFYFPDEARNVAISAEMKSPQDFFMPSFNGKSYYEKPPLYFWIIHSFAQKGFHGLAGIIGISFLFSLAIIIISFLFLYKNLDRDSAFAASLILITFPLYYVMSSLARMDIVFYLFLVLSIFMLYKSFNVNKYRYSMLAGLFSFLSCFTKGGLGLTLILVIGLVWSLINRPRKEYFKQLFCFLGVSFVLITAWLISFNLFFPGYFENMFIKQTFSRAFKPFIHKQPVWYYLPVFFAGFFPWSFLFVGYLVDSFNRKITESWEKFFLVWVFCGFLLLTILKTKMAMYLLIISLPLAGLIGLYVKRSASAKHLIRIITGLFCFGLLAVCIAIPKKIVFLPWVISLDCILFLIFFVFLKKESKGSFYGLFFSWLAIILTGNFLYQPYVSYNKGLKRVADLIIPLDKVERIVVDDEKLLFLDLYIKNIPVVFSKQSSEYLLYSVFISRYNKQYPFTFLGEKNKYKIWYKNDL